MTHKSLFKKKKHFILLEHRYIHPSDNEQQHIKDDEVPLDNPIQTQLPPGFLSVLKALDLICKKIHLQQQPSHSLLAGFTA